MKKFKIIFSSVTIFGLMGSISPALGIQVGPNTVSSQALINWDTLGYSGGSLSYYQNADMESLSEATTVDTSGNVTFDDDQVSGVAGWGNTTAASAYNLGSSAASALSHTAPTYLDSSATASSLYQGDTSYGLAESKRGAVFQVTSGGTISFSVDYSLASAVDSASGNYFTAAKAWSRLYLWNPATSSWDEYAPTLEEIAISSVLGSPLSLADSGVLSISGNFAAGQYGYAAWGTYAESEIEGFAAPVPLPSAFIIFGSGLLSLMGLRRKKMALI